MGPNCMAAILTRAMVASRRFAGPRARISGAECRDFAAQANAVATRLLNGEIDVEIARAYAADHPQDPRGDDLDAVRVHAVKALRHEQDLDLKAFGVRFDVYYLESSLYTDRKVEETIAALRDVGLDLVERTEEGEWVALELRHG